MASRAPAYLVLKNIPQTEWSFRIEERRKVLGRSATADIVIRGRCPTVSRRHAEIWLYRHKLWIRDLGSSSGTNVNGVWIDHVPQAEIVVADTIWWGGVEAEVVDEIDELANFPPSMEDSSPTNQCSTVPLARTLAHQLTPAEIDVMLWLSRGYQNDEEIGKVLHRSPNTVRTEVGNIFRKLDLHSRAELMGWLKRANHLVHRRRTERIDHDGRA
jgi:DNA-binding CsgD family transcriptional regulator